MDLPFPRCAMGLSFPRCAMDLRLWHYLVILIYFSYKSLATKTLYSHDVVQFWPKLANLAQKMCTL